MRPYFDERALRGAERIGLPTVADDLAPAAANVHFADELVNGELHFDYRLRPGPVQHSNAIELMRSVGLDV